MKARVNVFFVFVNIELDQKVVLIRMFSKDCDYIGMFIIGNVFLGSI